MRNPIKRILQVAAVMVNKKEISVIAKACNQRNEKRRATKSVEVKVSLETNPNQPIRKIRKTQMVEDKVNHVHGRIKEAISKKSLKHKISLPVVSNGVANLPNRCRRIGSKMASNKMANSKPVSNKVASNKVASNNLGDSAEVSSAAASKMVKRKVSLLRKRRKTENSVSQEVLRQDSPINDDPKVGRNKVDKSEVVLDVKGELVISWIDLEKRIKDWRRSVEMISRNGPIDCVTLKKRLKIRNCNPRSRECEKQLVIFVERRVSMPQIRNGLWCNVWWLSHSSKFGSEFKRNC
jgi:hypothetical protein